jgi:hypothetical protein
MHIKVDPKELNCEGNKCSGVIRPGKVLSGKHIRKLLVSKL